jgi:hypothetical protein
LAIRTTATSAITDDDTVETAASPAVLRASPATNATRASVANARRLERSFADRPPRGGRV